VSSFRFVTPGLLEALSVPLVEGRLIEEADRTDRALVAVVSRSFTERYWPGQSALGRTFRVREEERTVVGVVGDIKVRGLERIVIRKQGARRRHGRHVGTFGFVLTRLRGCAVHAEGDSASEKERNVTIAHVCHSYV